MSSATASAPPAGKDTNKVGSSGTATTSTGSSNPAPKRGHHGKELSEAARAALERGEKGEKLVTALFGPAEKQSVNANPAVTGTTQNNIDDADGQRATARLAAVLGEGSDNLDAAFSDFDDRISEFKDSPLVQQALQAGVDMHAYTKNVEAELSKVEQEHILEYVLHSHTLTELHAQTKNCDTILERLQTLLKTFQESLGQISNEIATLQDRSQSMGVRLGNRQKVQKELNTVLDGIVVDDALIKKLCEGEVNDSYLQTVVDLDKKIDFVSLVQGRNIRAFKDVIPELERLRIKVVDKLRDFFLQQFKVLRIPTSNISIQQAQLLKYRDAYLFVRDRHLEAAMELTNTYLNTVAIYYTNGFERYARNLFKLQADVVGKLDLLGVEESAKKGIFTNLKNALREKATFTVSERLAILAPPSTNATNSTHSAQPSSTTLSPAGSTGRESQAATEIILPQLAEDSNARYPFEQLFQSINRVLMDDAGSEYVFVMEFFGGKKKRAQIQREIFEGQNQAQSMEQNYQRLYEEIMEPSYRVVLAALKARVDELYDAISLLICIRLNTLNTLIMQKRRLPCLDNYFNALNLLLWPRFQAIIDMHVKSLKEADIRKLGVKGEIGPHYITRRYAEFAASIVALNHGFDDALVMTSLTRVRMEVQMLLMRLSSEVGNRRDKVVFLINNYDLMVSLLADNATYDPERLIWLDMLEAKTAEFVEEELKQVFGALLSFLSRSEIANNQLEKLSDEKFEAVAKEFNLVWKEGLSALNSSVMSSFPNFQNGARVVQVVFGRLIQHYSRFLQLWESVWSSRRLKGQPVGLDLVVVEIRKYKTTF